MANQSVTWDQTRFNAVLKQKLALIKTEKIPNSVNKTAFFVALGAYGRTPKKAPWDIALSVGKMTTVVSKDGRTNTIPLLWAIAAKRVGKTWAEKKMGLGIKNKSGRASVIKAYLSALRKKSSTILGSRKRASGFLKVGWLSVVKELSPFVKNKSGAVYPSESAKIYGRLKGRAVPAQPGWKPSCTIVSSPQAKSDTRNGLIRFGAPPMNDALDAEAENIAKYVDEELKPAFNEANRQLK